MNNTNIYQQLQKHYQKLTAGLAKAKQRGRSQSFQEQLLGRLQRCSMQMKQLGAGVAVVAALGVATPVAGQAPLPFVKVVPNPFSQSGPIPVGKVYDALDFVDLDGDMDLDVVAGTSKSIGGTPDSVLYYENTGSSSNPTYVLQKGANSPLPAFRKNELYTDFVDIDGDGDLDMFVAPHTLSIAKRVNINYYENIGTATNANFVLGAVNPLSDVKAYVDPILPTSNIRSSVIPSFVDIDNDGDQDCFVTISSYSSTTIIWPSSQNEDRILYYKNEGTATNPDLVRQTAVNNPLNSLAIALPDNEAVVKKLIFVEGSSPKDNDLDVLAGTDQALYYYENTGTKSSPVFSAASYNILDDAYSVVGDTAKYSSGNSLGSRFLRGVHDIDGDGKLEFLFYTPNEIFYLEDSSTYTNLQQVAAAKSIQVYPNPSTGVLQLEEPLTGTAFIYSTVGQELYSKELEAAQDLDISVLPTGTYLLLIRTKEESYQQTIIIQR